ncbi:nasonin-3 precursor [Nasonia vitripennis]|uniref:Uncharacterized protein n=2 Tax=Nasonia vitripennis TaxID=7425 RepID=A0A7M6US96_NASVI|nr:nasonin-3 precursor [Nasonia vitripennis]
MKTVYFVVLLLVALTYFTTIEASAIPHCSPWRCQQECLFKNFMKGECIQLQCVCSQKIGGIRP